MDFRLRQLKCFLVLTEKLNYGQAARAQFMTQPTLSFQIKSLEEDFGARLFDRSHKGVSLTPAGKQLELSARRILAEVESVRREISSLAARQSLRICCSQAGQFDILPRLIRYLAESDPDLRVEIEAMVPEERVQALISGKLDVLVMVAPVQAPGVSFQTLRRESLVAAVPDTPENRAKKEISIHELARSPLLVANERECSYCKEFSIGVMRRFHLMPEIIESPVNLNFQFTMIAAGRGVSISSESLLGLRFPGVLFLPFTEPMPKTKLGVAWRTNDDSPAVRLLHDALVRTAVRTVSDLDVPSMPVLSELSDRNNIKTL
jgi:DNA-binding transcriptional LysR family regulator